MSVTPTHNILLKLPGGKQSYGGFNASLPNATAMIMTPTTTADMVSRMIATGDAVAGQLHSVVVSDTEPTAGQILAASSGTAAAWSSATPYSPIDDTKWAGSPPATVGAALDRIAALLVDLNTDVPIPELV